MKPAHLRKFASRIGNAKYYFSTSPPTNTPGENENKTIEDTAATSLTDQTDVIKTPYGPITVTKLAEIHQSFIKERKVDDDVRGLHGT